VALSSWARASLRYRIARALLMGISNPTQQKEDSTTGRRFGSGQRWRAPCRAARFGLGDQPATDSLQKPDAWAGFLDSEKRHPGTGLRSHAFYRAR
jgi:hypothetical protein